MLLKVWISLGKMLLQKRKLGANGQLKQIERNPIRLATLIQRDKIIHVLKYITLFKKSYKIVQSHFIMSCHGPCQG